MIEKTVLYVDDEEINIELFKANFEDEFKVVTARSAKKGIEILKTSKDINVIVSDLKMPEMNGFEFIEHVKLFAPDTICIVLSAFMKHDFPESTFEDQDIFRYLNKPLRRVEMQRVLHQAFDTYNSLQEA
jgi:CheY-like chemotaxis protein